MIGELGQAAIFADLLVEGGPCPVCGSTHHPQPATAYRTPPSEVEIKNMRAAVANQETELQDLQAELSRYHSAMIRLGAERQPLLEILGDKAHLTLHQIEDEYRPFDLKDRWQRRTHSAFQT